MLHNNRWQNYSQTIKERKCAHPLIHKQSNHLSQNSPRFLTVYQKGDNLDINSVTNSKTGEISIKLFTVLVTPLIFLH